MLFHTIHAVSSVRAVVPTALMAGVSPTFFLVHTSWRTVSLILPSKWYYPVEDALWGWYQKLTVFYFEQCTGVKLKINGKIPNRKENCIFICNHQSSMDWIVADFLAVRQRMDGHMRYVFKSILKYFPLYGYVWGVHGGIFVTRDGKYNTDHMQSRLGTLMKYKVPLYLTIFPEGTRFATDRHELIAKSQGFAIQKRVMPLEHVLTPRVKAFYCGLQCLKQYIDAVYDVTIIYDTKLKLKGSGKRLVRAPSMWDVLSGDCKEINLIFDRIPMYNIPIAQTADYPTFAWLHKRFALKDYQIALFYGLNVTKETSNNIVNSYSKPHTATDKPALNDFDANFPMKNMNHISSTTTTLSMLTLTSLTAGLLVTKTGRKIYCMSAIGGTVMCWFYAKLFL